MASMNLESPSESPTNKINYEETRQRPAQFYQMKGKNVASMPTITEMKHFTPEKADDSNESGLDHLSSDKEASSKVWGNSVLSANHDTPIDNWIENNEDLDDIR